MECQRGRRWSLTSDEYYWITRRRYVVHLCLCDQSYLFSYIRPWSVIRLGLDAVLSPEKIFDI